MQVSSSRIWSQIAESIFNDDNHYTTNCFMKVLARRWTLVFACIGVHRKMLFMNLSLVLQQCFSCLIHLTSMICKMLSKQLNSSSIENIMDADCADDLTLLVNKLVQTNSLLHCLEPVARGFIIYVNADKTK